MFRVKRDNFFPERVTRSGLFEFEVYYEQAG